MLFKFEAMDAKGEEIRDVIEAPSEEEAQSTIRQLGYFVTRISPITAKEAAIPLGSVLDPKSKKRWNWCVSAEDKQSICHVALKCVVAVMSATLLFEFAKTGDFNHNLFIEVLLVAIYNNLLAKT
jgi:hypothetical protein